MRSSILLFCFLANLPMGFAQSAMDKLERVPLYGNTYVRLGDWARLNNFEIQWVRKDEEVRLTNRSANLRFTVDSRKAEINGVSVYLSVPVARRNGTAYIAPLDLRTVVNPVLFPPKNKAGTKVKTICLDPGHGGKDPGNQDGKNQEKQFTLLLAKEVRSLLSNAGFKVVLSRSTDRYVERMERPAIAKRSGADLFVSLHYNSTDGSRNVANGVEVYCMTPAGASSTNARGDEAPHRPLTGNAQDQKNFLLAYQIQKAMVNSLDLEDRGVKRARFVVLYAAEMPAVLIEGGFMTDPAEARKIYDATHRRKMAQAIVDGLLAYKRLVER